MGQINYYAAQVNALLGKANSAVQPETTGDLATLATQNKDNLVAAVNEVYAGAGGEYVERAEAAAEAAEEVLESIPEDYSDLSDEVGDLKSAFDNANNILEDAINNGLYTLSSNDVESGGWAYSTKFANNKRLRNKFLIPVRAGMIIQYTNPTLQLGFGIMATRDANSYVQSTSAWINPGNTNARYAINYNGYLVININSSSAITVSDYDCTISLLSSNIVSRNWISETYGATADIDDIKQQGVYFGNYTNSYVNIPFNWAAPFQLIVIEERQVITQIAINLDKGEVATRYYTNNSWSDWQREFSTRNWIDFTYGATADIDEIRSQGIYFGKTPNTYVNAPLGWTQAFQLIVIEEYLVVTQIAFNLNTGDVATRYYSSGAWINWHSNIGHEVNRAGKYFAFGDSTTWGYSSDHSHAQSPWNYPALVGKLIGVEVHNLGDPAQGLLKDWTSPATAGNFPIVDTIAQMVEDGDFTGATLITVAWAYNDNSMYSTVNFGSPTDAIPSQNTGITTWLGYYARVLKLLQDAAPDAVVVLITGYGYTTSTDGHKTDEQFTHSYSFADGAKTVRQMYDALEEMANYNGFYCINQAKGSAINRVNGSYIIGDNIHPTYDNYRIYSNFIAARIASVFQNL